MPKKKTKKTKVKVLDPAPAPAPTPTHVLWRNAICNKKQHPNNKYHLEYLSELYNLEHSLAEQTRMDRRKIGYSKAKYSWNPGSAGTLIPPEDLRSDFSENPENFIKYQKSLLLQQIDEGDELINITRYSPIVIFTRLRSILNERGVKGGGLNPAAPLPDYHLFAQNNIDTYARNLTKKTEGFFPSHCLHENAMVIQVGLDTEWWGDEAAEDELEEAGSDESPLALKKIPRKVSMYGSVPSDGSYESYRSSEYGEMVNHSNPSVIDIRQSSSKSRRETSF